MLRGMSQRSRARKAVSVTLGVILALAGALGFLYMYFHVVEPVKILYWAIPVFVFGTGIAILWDDFRES